MCIIVYKPAEAKFPNKETIKNCFENNPDGAGYMFSAENKVNITKGYMTFKGFWKALKSDRKRYGDNVPFVLHFRIGTQGGNIPENTHPFPLTNKEKFLRALDLNCNIGIAHNGIITMCSDSKSKLSDTQIFIKEYLSNLIDDTDYYKEKWMLNVIEELAGSKLAILDHLGHCELIGKFIEDNGVYYSNDSYSISRTYSPYIKYLNDDYYNYGKEYKHHIDKYGYCEEWGVDYEYCLGCTNKDSCYTPYEQKEMQEEIESYYKEAK